MSNKQTPWQTRQDLINESAVDQSPALKKTAFQPLHFGSWTVSSLIMYLLGPKKEAKLATSSHQFSRWWFQTFFIFTPTWGRFPFWLTNIFEMGWNHQPVFSGELFVKRLGGVMKKTLLRLRPLRSERWRLVLFVFRFWFPNKWVVTNC